MIFMQKKIIRLSALVGGLALTPALVAVCFCVFSSDSISIEAWLNFWIGYLSSLAVTASLLVVLYTIVQIENAHVADRMNSEGMLFIPTRVERNASWFSAFEFAVYFPRELLLLKDVTIDGITCTYCSEDLKAETVSLLNVDPAHFILQFDNSKKTREVLSHWERVSDLSTINDLWIEVHFSYTRFECYGKSMSCAVHIKFGLTYSEDEVEITKAVRVA